MSDDKKIIFSMVGLSKSFNNNNKQVSVIFFWVGSPYQVYQQYNLLWSVTAFTYKAIAEYCIEYWIFCRVVI